jgi:tricorn protease
MFRYPDVSQTQIAFVYAGDIWIVDKKGGLANQLSSPPGEEQFPRFSPDGSRIAYSANYDGNPDVYVVSTGGGVPNRVTHHPGDDRLVDWAPDGDALLFASNRSNGVYVRQFFRVSPDGGFPEKLPVPYGEFGALTDDQQRIAYTTKAREFRTWKRYRGGLAPDIWLFDLKTFDARNLSASDANDAQPMWHGETLYFLSDRGPKQRSNIWALDGADGTPRQVTHFEDVDVSWPAIGPMEIVFQAGGRLYLLDLADESSSEISVQVTTDQATLRPRRVSAADDIQAAAVSPSGARAVFDARGELFTVPAEHGIIRQLTRDSASATRYPSWSPDGAHIAYWSDAGGEYELTLIDAQGGGEPQTLTELGPGYRYQPHWSPDSTKIAFIDNTQTIQVLDVESKKITRVDEGLFWLHPTLNGFQMSWSADSRWVAYHRQLETGTTAIFLFDTADGKLHQVTSGYYTDTGPVFDPDGKYLYYRSNRELRPIYSDLDATWVYPNTTQLVAAALRSDVPSPLPPRNDDEPTDEDEGEGDDSEGEDDGEAKGEEKEDGDEGDDEEEDEPEPVEIDLEGLESRVVVLPPEAGNYGTVRAVSGKLVYQRYPRSGSSEESSPVLLYDFEEREEQTVLEDVDGFAVTADGKKLFILQDGAFAIVDLKQGAKVEDRLATGELQTIVDPRAEWGQMFNDVWRIYRDNFYDPEMHGLDWDGVGEQYRKLLDDAVTRWDVTFVMGELIGEINASHTYVGGGDTERQHRRGVGLLGIDWALENGAYKIERIVQSAPWDADSRSPLDQPGVEVAEGDYILAVNGAPIDTKRDPWAALAGLAGQTVQLTVNDKPSTEGAREILVETLRNDRRLRQLDWIEANRRRVLEASDGKIGYVYVPDTSVFGQTELVRQYTSQAGKAGLVVDERWNGGGQLPDRFVELMSRQRLAYLFFRYGSDLAWPAGAHHGPKAMLINGWAGSGGDAFPFFFREMKAGPLIGERTWGGLIGPAFGHGLVDGGGFTAPPGRIYGPDGTWFAEGHGVDPDIPVVDDPSELARGRDPQLEAAIAEVMKLLETQAPEQVERPPFELRVP